MSIIFLAILHVCILQHCIFHALQYKEISQYYKSHLFHCMAGGEQKNTGTKKKDLTLLHQTLGLLQIPPTDISADGDSPVTLN